jgi:t-SNARE complex subunit (syntaxin)
VPASRYLDAPRQVRFHGAAHVASHKDNYISQLRNLYLQLRNLYLDHEPRALAIQDADKQSWASAVKML